MGYRGWVSAQSPGYIISELKQTTLWSTRTSDCRGGGAGLKTVFVSVCGNLQHIRQNIRFLKFFCFLARAL